MMVHAHWLKFNDRILVRLDEGGATPATTESANGTDHAVQKGQVLEIDGQAYQLKTYLWVAYSIRFKNIFEKAREDVTDPSVDTSGSWEEEEETKDHYGHNEHDPFTSASVFEAETRKVQDDLEFTRKQVILIFSCFIFALLI